MEPQKEIEECIAIARESLDSGRALATLKNLSRLINEAMKDILSEIIAHKQTEIELQKQTVSPEQLQEQAGVIIRENAAHRRSMKQALAASSTGIISEFKRRSPSKGWINEAAQAEEIPASYEAAAPPPSPS